MPSGENVRNKGLDLVRAIAVSLVLICHGSGMVCYWLGVRWPLHLAVTGFFGVELFFALSGFLIGRLLLDLIERDVSLRAWGRFMLRRWMRTLPAYGVCLAAFALLWPAAQQSGAYWFRYATFTQNLLWPMPADNWFGVSWSLSVEEWFYLLFSAFLVATVAAVGRRRNAATWAVLALFVLVPTALRWQVPDDLGWEDHLRKVAMLRLDAIAYGVILAKLCRGNAALVRNPVVLLAVGLAITLEVWFQPLSLAWVPPHVMRTFELSVAPLALALCLPAATRISRLPAIGRIIHRLSLQSYSLYLVHLTALEAIDAARAHFHWSPAQSILAALVLIAGVSTAITKWVELPIMALRPRQYPLLPPANKRPIPSPSRAEFSGPLEPVDGINQKG